MTRITRLLIVVSLTVAVSAGMLDANAIAGKPNTMGGCMTCHQSDDNVVRGKLVSHSSKFGSIQVDIGPLVWIINYDDKTEFVGKETLETAQKGKELAVTWTGTETSPMAARVSFKPEMKVPAEQLLSSEDMRSLVIAGPEKGAYMLIDSRPPDAYAEGHIPYAVNIPFPKLKKMGEAVLPQDKSFMLVFYCGGPT